MLIYNDLEKCWQARIFLDTPDCHPLRCPHDEYATAKHKAIARQDTKCSMSLSS